MHSDAGQQHGLLINGYNVQNCVTATQRPTKLQKSHSSQNVPKMRLRDDDLHKAQQTFDLMTHNKRHLLSLSLRVSNDSFVCLLTEQSNIVLRQFFKAGLTKN